MAVRYEQGEPPPLLSLFYLCKQMNCLPDPGGLNQQQNKYYEAFQLIANLLAEKQTIGGGARGQERY